MFQPDDTVTLFVSRCHLAVGAVDAALSWKIDDQLETGLEAINLTNGTSNEWVGTTAWKRRLTCTQTGREYRVGLRCKF